MILTTVYADCDTICAGLLHDVIEDCDTTKNEIAEMENLIQNHYKVPSFESNLTLPLGSSITLTDKNNVLNNYKISFYLRYLSGNFPLNTCSFVELSLKTH